MSQASLLSRYTAVVRELDGRVSGLRDQISRLDGKIEVAEALAAEAKELEADAFLTLQARLLLESYSEDEQAQLLGKIQGLVSRGLQVIFGPGYSFSIEMGQSRGQVTTEFRVSTGDGARDPLGAHGGGLVNVVAFVLRLVVVALTPSLSRTIVLDEPFAQLSAGYLEGVGEFLRELCDATGIQLIIVSHEAEISAVADRAWRMSVDDGRMRVRELS